MGKEEKASMTKTEIAAVVTRMLTRPKDGNKWDRKNINAALAAAGAKDTTRKAAIHGMIEDGLLVALDGDLLQLTEKGAGGSKEMPQAPPKAAEGPKVVHKPTKLEEEEAKVKAAAAKAEAPTEAGPDDPAVKKLVQGKVVKAMQLTFKGLGQVDHSVYTMEQMRTMVNGDSMTVFAGDESVVAIFRKMHVSEQHACYVAAFPKTAMQGSKKAAKAEAKKKDEPKAKPAKSEGKPKAEPKEEPVSESKKKVIKVTLADEPKPEKTGKGKTLKLKKTTDKDGVVKYTFKEFEVMRHGKPTTDVADGQRTSESGCLPRLREMLSEVGEGEEVGTREDLIQGAIDEFGPKAKWAMGNYIALAKKGKLTNCHMLTEGEDGTLTIGEFVKPKKAKKE